MTELLATYRLQLGGAFGFAQARELVPYLRDLGVSHLYLPPSFQAREGSTHGYDVVDPGSISAELGGEGVPRAPARGPGGRDGDRPRHRAQPHGGGRRQPLLVGPGAAGEVLRHRYRDRRHRRFFDIDHLAGVRQEDQEVFEETHRLALALVREGIVDGLRIDHPDGLADPAGYLRRLRERGVQHVWVEKIVDPGEQLRDWPVEGTVGYEFLNDVAALFVDPAGEAPLTALWEGSRATARPFAEYAVEAKLEQARRTFAPEVERLRREAPREVGGLERALASLPVYRTYVEPWRARVEAEDREALAEAGLPESLARVLRLEERGWDAFVTRFQQTTPPVMAKGVEDTAFYRYARLLALNDVGGDPGRFGISVDEFHAANAERAERFPRNLLVTQTHDTKRSGDVRARIGALSSMPEEWAARVRRWLDLRRDRLPTAPRRRRALPHPPDAGRAPGRSSASGCRPTWRRRCARPSARPTGSSPTRRTRRRCRRSARRSTRTRRSSPTSSRSRPSWPRAGDRAALGQLLLKLTVPGVPDVYQGDELLSLSLVDPDNRRPVDWELRRRLLAECGAAPRRRDESRKLWLIVRALVLRRRRPAAFAGAYEPLDAGPRRSRSCAAATCSRRPRSAATATRVALPPGRWRDVLAGGEHERPRGPDGIALLARLGSPCIATAGSDPAARLNEATGPRAARPRAADDVAGVPGVGRRPHPPRRGAGRASSRCSRSSRSRCCSSPRSGSCSTTPRCAQRVVKTVFENIPLSAEDDRARLEATVSEALKRAGRIGPFSILLLIVAGSGMMGALRHTINEAWDIHERPPLLRRKALDLALDPRRHDRARAVAGGHRDPQGGERARRRGGRRLVAGAARPRRRRAPVRVHAAA